MFYAGITFALSVRFDSDTLVAWVDDIGDENVELLGRVIVYSYNSRVNECFEWELDVENWLLEHRISGRAVRRA